MKQFIVMAFVLLQAMAASAQQAIENIFRTTILDDKVEVLSRTDQNYDCPDGGASYCQFTEFIVPGKRKSTIDQIEKTLTYNQRKAYDVYVKKESGGKSSSVVGAHSYVYGPNNEYKVTMGGNKSHNYHALCFTEPQDSIRRHAYCFVWFKDNLNYRCYYYHIYGVKPANAKEFNAAVAKRSGKSSTTVRTRTFSDGNVVVTQTYDSDGNVVRTESLPQSLAGSTEVKTDIDFMLQFGNLRVAFLDAVKDAGAKTLQTGIVVKILRLCRENAKLLTENEKRTCISSINEMSAALKKANADSFVDGMLQEARVVLQR